MLPIHDLVAHASYTSATITLRNTMLPAPSNLVGPGPEESHDNNDKGSTDKRKPVRRDHEKRRQQNIKAQKKYRRLSISASYQDPAHLKNISDPQGQARS